MSGDQDQTPQHAGSGRIVWADVTTNLVNCVTRYGFLAWAVYQLRFMIEALAGQVTSATFVVDWFQGVRCGTVIVVALVVVGLAVSWAIGERWFRRDQADRMGRDIQVQQKRLDPDRSSSGVERGGTTHPRDNY